jgi:superfamily II DNA or RNA helicase
VAFLCNRINLVSQTSRRFLRSGISHGVIQGSNTTRTYENVLVASIQTVAKRGLPEVDLLVIDEGHSVAGSKDYRNIIFGFKGPVIALSATPWSRGLGKQYDELGGALFEQMVIAATIPELIADGYLVDCDVYAPSEPDMTGIKQSKNAYGEMDYSDADIGRATDKPELIGDIVATWKRLAFDTATVCFASNIAHSKHIVEQFAGAGVPAEHIDCYTDDDERKAILERVEAGITKVISNVGILCEGWDFPACRTLILARPTKSLIRYIQMAGRVLRPHETKDKALILDHSGTVVRLGFPTDEFPMELDDGKPKDPAATKQKEDKLPKACPKCSYLSKAHKCPVCGFAPERQANGIETGEGELVLLKKGKFTLEQKQDWYSQLRAVAASKGYQEGWISHKYKEKFGVWPKGLRDTCKEPTVEVKKFLQYLNIRRAKSNQGANRAAA